MTRRPTKQKQRFIAVVFSVTPEDDVSPGTEFRNDASFVFDSNPPIETGDVVHVIGADRAKPSSGGIPLLLVVGVVAVVLAVAAGAILRRRH